ncbi:MAG TPA: error-prone DNA polymerase [Acidimicrobiales bacterium]|nr:error-prone DNA polymerase [Acidimicrobiales bacterium]
MHSNFSFLDGASHPEELVAEASRLGLSGLALTDHDGLYGVVRFAEAARVLDVPTVFGVELALSPSAPRTGVPDPGGTHLIVLARDPEGYARLSRGIAEAHLAGGEKGKPIFTLDDLAGCHGGHWQVLTGCRKGAVAGALTAGGPAAAGRQLDHLIDRFGADNVAVELWDHGDPLDTARNDALALLAVERGVSPVATNNVHYASPARFPLATALAAVRARRPLDELQGWLPPSAIACLRSEGEQRRRFARWPGVIERAAEIAAACTFDLHLVAPRLPDFPVPAGHTEQTWLTELVRRGALDRYGSRQGERVPGAWERLDHELAVIDALGFPGYFLTVWDIVRFCREQDIFCQGRGSAATSAVCYALGITNVDAVSLGLLFERFLSPARDGPPDIDVDIESGRREEVIQYVYQRYGRLHAAQVANVITYRSRSALRDIGKALGHPLAEVEGWAGSVDRGDSMRDQEAIPSMVRDLAGAVLDFPRHLGIHSGGMVICDRPVVEVCPVEWARMPGRSVLQWDKDDCAAVGLVKFDLLGLGMLTALHHMVDLVASHHGVRIDVALIDQEPEVYDLLCRADTVGVFQVESRAQMGTLPRVKPRCFYDLAIEVALIRPGPIQGNAVHPYIRRRNKEEDITYLHPLLKPALERTLGVPLFQEQLMQIAIDVAGFTPAQADELRQAMGAKRSGERMSRLRDRLFAGMAARDVSADVAEQVYAALAAFANFGFPESHSVAFAYLVYSTAWFKVHYPAAFTAGLLNAQPMGFWSPQSLIADAKRHGVAVERPDVNGGGADARLEGDGPAIRLGLSSVRGIGSETAERIAAGQPWSGLEDLVRRAGVTRAQLEALATAGAMDGLPAGSGPTTNGKPAAGNRRSLVWAAGAAAQATPGRLPGVVTGAESPPLPTATPWEDVADDLWALGMTPDITAMELARPELRRQGVVPSGDLGTVPSGDRVTVGGVVTHRQHPESAHGAVFLNLEDETGMVNVICSRGAWVRWRSVARFSPALVVRGRLERGDGAVNLVAERIEPLELGPVPPSRDFR